MEPYSIIKAVGGFGPRGSAVPGVAPRLVDPANPGKPANPGFIGTINAFAGAQASARARADELAERTEKLVQNPLTRAFLGLPSGRPASPGLRTVAAMAGALPRPKAAAGAVDLLGGRPVEDLSWTNAARGSSSSVISRDQAQSWQALGPFGGRPGTARPSLEFGGGLLSQPSLTGARGSRPGFSFVRAYDPLPASNLLDLPAFDGARRFVEGYFGIAKQLDKLVAGWTKPLGELLERARRAIESYPRDSEGRLIPPWNARLYLLARAAYYGKDYAAQARFLDAIGADGTSIDELTSNVLLIGDLLAPAFDPKRPDRRKEWWLLDPDEARRALRDRLGSLRSGSGEVRKGGELSYVENPKDDENPQDPYFFIAKRAPRTISAEGTFFGPELGALMLQELDAVLTPRQHEVVTLAMLGWKYEQIAHELGITAGAVKAHMHKVRHNPLVSEILLPRPSLRPGGRPGGTQTRGRTHRA